MKRISYNADMNGSRSDRVRLAILRVLEIYKEPRFIAWAEAWLWGLDRTVESAWVEVLVASRAAAVHTGKREAVALAARAAAWAAGILGVNTSEIPDATKKITAWAQEAIRLADDCGRGFVCADW